MLFTATFNVGKCSMQQEIIVEFKEKECINGGTYRIPLLDNEACMHVHDQLVP